MTQINPNAPPRDEYDEYDEEPVAAPPPPTRPAGGPAARTPHPPTPNPGRGAMASTARPATRPPLPPAARRRSAQPIPATPARANNLIMWATVGGLTLVTVLVGGLLLTGKIGGLGAQATMTPNLALAPTVDRSVITGTPNYTPPPDGVVARVNGQPINGPQWERRIGIDRQMMAADPFSAMLLGNFEGITGTRMLDILRQDSLDKLINYEVVQQQAAKEGMVPSATEQEQITAKAREQSDLVDPVKFTAFLQQNSINEQQYTQDIVRRVVYSVMANKHMPKSSNPEEMTNKFIEWICTTRRAYEVKIFVTFQVDNPTCTSGLPLPEVPLEGLPTALPEAQPSGVPAAIPTAVVPVATPKK